MKQTSWRHITLLLILALLVRLLTAWPQQQPNYMDAAYSYVNALNLAQGQGFVEDFVWNYLDNPLPPPHPSHLYWMPLTSILAGLGMLMGGLTYRGAQIPFVILSALLVPLTYWVAYYLSKQRWQALIAALLAIFSGFYFPFWTAIDNFTPFAIAGSLALFFAWLGMKPIPHRNQPLATTPQKSSLPLSSTYLIISGLFVGLAHLARADGLLLLIAAILTYLIQLIFNHPPPKNNYTPYALRTTQYITRLTLFLLLGYLIVMLPWFIRNWQIIGQPLSGAGTQTIWLRDYDDLFSYERELSAQTFFAQDLSAIAQGRWWALKFNLQTVWAVWGMIFLAPLTLIGMWHLRRHGLVQLVSLYAVLLFGVMTLLFAFPGARGGLFHSGTALLPFIYALSIVGLDRAVDWVAARRRGWQAPTAKRVFGVGLIVMAIALSAFIYYRQIISWNSADLLYPTIANWVAARNPAAIVMIGNPPAYRYHGGGLSVVVPNEDVETTLKAARHYQVTYLILDRNHPAPLAKLYKRPDFYPDLLLAHTFGKDTATAVHIFEVLRER